MTYCTRYDSKVVNFDVFFCFSCSCAQDRALSKIAPSLRIACEDFMFLFAQKWVRSHCRFSFKICISLAGYVAWLSHSCRPKVAFMHGAFIHNSSLFLFLVCTKLGRAMHASFEDAAFGWATNLGSAHVACRVYTLTFC